MLRAILILIGLVLLGCGLFVLRFSAVAAFPPLAGGVLLLLGTLFEGRYRPRVRSGADGWEPTGERFIDPGTGKLVDVVYNPKTGEREYKDVPPSGQ
ncbi:MAG TPA: hypothetical protein VFO29_01180 [Candidatus Rubrimentiphilum sp.]|nr:hypothetical protein [Candidatus Rubrimentiphilum sp.]